MQPYDRRKFCANLVTSCKNDWDGNDELDELMQAPYAVVMQRSYDSWVVGVETIEHAVAQVYAFFMEDSADFEYLSAVYDLRIGALVEHKVTYSVTVQIDGLGEGTS